MKIVIAGGRDYIPTQVDWNTIKAILIENKATEIVCGGCRGADQFGRNIGASMGIPSKNFLPDWSLGKKAGPMRNAKMAKYCDAVILMPGRKGTESMRIEAKKAGKPILYDAGNK